MKYKHIAISEKLHHFVSLRKTFHKMTFEQYLTMISTREAGEQTNKKPTTNINAISNHLRGKKQ